VFAYRGVGAGDLSMLVPGQSSIVCPVGGDVENEGEVDGEIRAVVVSTDKVFFDLVMSTPLLEPM